MLLMNRILLCTVFIVSVQLLAYNLHAQSGPPPQNIYNVDWNEKLAPNLGLKAHTNELLGDQIDLNTGRLSFEHIDVSIPGNSHLPVEIRRRVNPSQPFNNEFADWYLDIPRISTNINGYDFERGNRWGKTRCSLPLVNSIPVSNLPKNLDSSAQPLQPYEYSNGVILDIPGSVSTAILDKGTALHWPSGAKKVTAKNWYLTCISNIDGNGTEGFYAHAPNGDKYKFDIIHHKVTSQSDLWRVYSVNGVTHAVDQKYLDILYASEVTDKDGNWVKYNYDASKRLTSITSNDSRTVNIEYVSSTSKNIKTVTANYGTADAQIWNYAYGSKGALEWEVPAVAYDAPTTVNRFYSTLTSVTRPDGKAWLFNLAGLYAKPIPGTQYEHRVLQGGVRKLSGVMSPCKQQQQIVSIAHPDGAKGEFTLEERNYFIPVSVNAPHGAHCPKTVAGVTSLPFQDVMSITKKKLTSSSTPDALWTYSYQSPFSSNPFNITTIISPDNTKRINYYHPPEVHTSLAKSELYENQSATQFLEKTDFTYLIEATAGGFYSSYYSTVEQNQPIRITETKITRGSDWYNTKNTYNTDVNSATYSYGYPTKVEQWSSLGGGTRITDTTYLKDVDDWIVGIPDTVTQNGKLLDDYDWDDKGRLISHKKFGVTVATLGYHTSGTQSGQLNWYRDALNRQTTFTDYYRGIPRTITRADNTSFTRVINANGLVTRETNWRNIATDYQYNNSGYLTLIDRPNSWSDTSISYAPSSSGLTQTITTGGEQTTTTYDAMLRPISVFRFDRSHSNKIYNETKYDALGRVIFTSLPATTPGSTTGIETSYDALGRKNLVRETAAGGGTTYFSYLAGNKTRVTDPMGNITATTASGYGNPDDGKPISIQKPEGITTNFTYDIYGNVLTMAQAKGDGTNLTSNYTYDSGLRLCRVSILERGDTLYAYDNANQLTGYAEGQGAGSVCMGLPTGNNVVLGYDNLGRLLTTDYPGSTPDISRTYDENSNILTINRGGINWTYNYNNRDLITSEVLTVDARTYSITNSYDNDGHMTRKTFPSNQFYYYPRNGFGQELAILKSNAEILGDIKFHPNGKIKSLLRGNGGSYQQYLNDRQFTSYIGSNWGESFSYYYNANGQISDIHSSLYGVYSRSFGYDGAGRLSSASGPWGSATYRYDPLGNITQKAEGSRVVDIQYNNNNQIAYMRDSATGNNWRTYNHDSRGNVINDSRYQFNYDFANQPISLSGTKNGSYAYDGNLKRVKQVVAGETIYSIYDKSGALLTQDNATSGIKTDFVSLAGQTFVRVKNGASYYPINDHLGTAIMEADQNGNIPASKIYNYNPFGENINHLPFFATTGNDPGNNNEQGFTGHIEDNTGLVYMQARYYDPVIGRFLSPDPIGYADQLNQYAYVHNDPVNKIDPDGRQCRSIGTTIGYSCNYLGGAATAINDRKNYDPQTAVKIDVANTKEAIKEVAIAGVTSALPGGIFTRVFGKIFGLVAGKIGGKSFEIIDGVRRAKAAELSGQRTINAEIVDANDKIIGYAQLPLNLLKSPKANINVSGSTSNMDRWLNTLTQTQSASKPPPILVTEGTKGILIRDVGFN